MTYFRFLDSVSSATPHMQPLDAETLDEARREAERLMGQHTQAYAARIFLNTAEIEVLTAERGRS